jgi:hypothetical protein
VIRPWVTVAPFPAREKPQDSPDAAIYLTKNAKYISRLQRRVCNLDLFGDSDRESADDRIRPMELGFLRQFDEEKLARSMPFTDNRGARTGCS